MMLFFFLFVFLNSITIVPSCSKKALEYLIKILNKYINIHFPTCNPFPQLYVMGRMKPITLLAKATVDNGKEMIMNTLNYITNYDNRIYLAISKSLASQWTNILPKMPVFSPYNTFIMKMYGDFSFEDSEI